MSGVALYGAEATITASNGKNIIKGSYSSPTSTGGNALYANNNANIHLNAQRNEAIARAGIFSENSSNVDLIATKNGNLLNAEVYGIVAQQNSTAKLTAYSGNNEITSGNYGIYAQSSSEVNLTTNAGNNKITASGRGIYSNNTDTKVILNAMNNKIIAATYGIDARSSSNVELTATQKSNVINAQQYGIYTANLAIAKLNANQDNIIYGKTYGVVVNGASTTLDAEKNNIVSSENRAVYAYTNADVDLTADANNLLYAGELNRGYGKSYAINAIGQSDVDLIAGETNLLRGAVYASGSIVTDENKVVTDVNMQSSANMVLSNAYIANAGGLKDKNVISALYAEKGAHIELDGDYNLLGTYADSESPDLERVVWAYEKANIEITGLTAISTDSYDLATNSKDIAIAAGTATGLEELGKDAIENYNGERAAVNINYESDSSITGDILSAYAGEVNIKANDSVTRAASDSKMYIRGNLLAGNNGILNVNLGNGGQLTGRADDYGDAGVAGTAHGAGEETENSFFNPAFSSEIITGGEVNLIMGEGSVWNVTGQSWITELNTTDNAQDTLINLENAKEDYNTSASALTIGTLKGDTRFYMNLDGDRSASDMLYIKNADGKYDIYLQEEVLSSEINSDKAGNTFNGLRFATVGEGNAEFTVRSQGTGSAFDVEYEVGTDSYENNSENTAYNSTGGGEGNVEKPGNASVDDFFGLNDTSSQANAENNIMLMAETDEAIDTAANSAENSTLDEVTNFKIVKRLGEELNDTGKTILNMSRANYSNAIYMDRLNKRLGEARYINSEEDEGMWVRIRHDRIGKDDAYRSQNTMYELGYDQKQECDNGERRVGMAIDYMHGDTGYNDIAGKGEIDRYGLWLYDTWMGDKGHYADYVAKWGHLSNDFEVYTMNDKTKQVTGDYSNNVFSVSAEYGRKKDIGGDWYFEPQVQAQLARVTGADYTTNQGTKVSVDGINSLIGRAGFRLGKDFGEEKQSTVYIKADVLHEFLGDQDVRVLDKSSDNKWAGISYENEGTWYDVGFGFATQMSKNSYAFMDFEKSFGNDNDETYQINVGMQWSF